MPTRITSVVVLLSLGSLAANALAQSRWREIGKTSAGNPVFVDPKTVRKGADGIVTATIRTTFVKAVATPKGPLTASRTVAMFDCTKRLYAVKENIFYHDERANRIYEKRTIAKPGYGSPIKGTLPDIALHHLCST